MQVHTRVFAALTRYQLAADIDMWGWKIGPKTYGRPQILEPTLAGLTIGNFCSIGPNVTLILGNHRSDLVTTYPFKALAGFWQTPDGCPDDHDTHGDIMIGNDVWIGAGATILSGTHIGDGAVIGAQSVVRGVVEPYAIVAGNPAKMIRKRFDDSIIERLLAVRWWDWNDARVRQMLPYLLSNDMELFLARATQTVTGTAGVVAQDAALASLPQVRQQETAPTTDG